jgi:hypothetical protein
VKSLPSHVEEAVASRLARPEDSGCRVNVSIGGPPLFEVGPDGRERAVPAVRYAWGALSLVSTALCAYHGYARNESVGWGVLWGIAGGAFPIFALPIAYAQGFATPANGGVTPAIGGAAPVSGGAAPAVATTVGGSGKNPFKVGDRVICKTALETCGGVACVAPPCDTTPGIVTGVGAGVHDPFPGGHVVDDPADLVEVQHDGGDTLAWTWKSLVKYEVP